MKLIVCAFALCCIFAFEIKADEIVIVPTAGQLSWTHFQGPASDVASLTATGVGFSIQVTKNEAIGKQWSGLCPLTCNGNVTFNGFTARSFNWSASSDGVTVSGRLSLFDVNLPLPPGTPLPPPVFTLVFDVPGNLLIDTSDRFLIVITDQTAIPEPASILLLSSGFAGFLGAKFRKRFHQRGNRSISSKSDS